MRIGSHESLSPFPVEHDEETRFMRSVRGHRCGINLHEANSHPDLRAARREDPCRAPPPTASTNEGLPPEAFFGDRIARAVTTNRSDLMRYESIRQS